MVDRKFSSAKPYIIISLIYLVLLLHQGLKLDDDVSPQVMWYILLTATYCLIVYKFRMDASVAVLTWSLATIGLATLSAFDDTGILKSACVNLWVAILAAAVFVRGYVAVKENLDEKKLLVVLFVANLMTFLLTLLVGRSINGTRAWIYLGSHSFQMTEMNLLLTTLYTGEVFSREANEDVTKIKQLAPLLATDLVGFLLERELGSLVIILALTGMMAMLFMNKRTLCWIGIVTGVPMLVVIGVALWMYREHVAAGDYQTLHWAAKILFDQTEKVIRRFQIVYQGLDPLGDGFQNYLSRHELMLAGLTGRLYKVGAVLPVRDSEYMFVSTTYYFGWIAGLGILIFYIGLFVRMMYLSLRSRKNRGVIAAGAVCIFVNAAINILGETGVIPLTGITLPYLSNGGSSLIRCLVFAMLCAQGIKKRKRIRDKKRWIYEPKKKCSEF